MAIVAFLLSDAVFATEIDEPAFVAAHKEVEAGLCKEELSRKGPRNEDGF